MTYDCHMLFMCEQNDQLQDCLVRYVDILNMHHIKSVFAVVVKEKVQENIKLAYN